MNFTREPIIETVITPRDGCKLVVRNSKGMTQEDYIVDAIEVVSFGHSFFFRSQERPKSFLVPVSDYEVIESKETRMVLKNVATDRSIKIGGGREAPPRSREESRPREESVRREESHRPREEFQDETLAESRPAPDRSQERPINKRDNNKRRRGRRGRDRHQEYPQEARSEGAENQESQQGPMREDLHRPMEGHQSEESFRSEPEVVEKAPSFISKLFPPPTTLIKESLSRYKPVEEGQENGSSHQTPIHNETIFEHPTTKNAEDDNEE